jgi:hypothetical protein
LPLLSGLNALARICDLDSKLAYPNSPSSLDSRNL